MTHLHDTNVISEMMRSQPNEDVAKWFFQQQIYRLSAVTVEEIRYGLTYKNAVKQGAWFDQFIDKYCIVLPVNRAVADRCGRLRGQLKKRGVNKPQSDLFIAATAIEHDLILATRNVRDFADTSVKLFNPFASEG